MKTVLNVNGELIEKEVEYIPSDPTEPESVPVEIQIIELKHKLADTDYIACKIAEGVSTVEEYADIIEERKQWRNEINRLESHNESLNGIIKEGDM